MSWLQSRIDVYLESHRVEETIGGEILLSPESALTLLAAIFREGGPCPAYVDVYSKTVDGGLHFKEDLTMRGVHDQEPDRHYEDRLLAHLEGLDSSCSVALYDSALGIETDCKQMSSSIADSFLDKSNAK